MCVCVSARAYKSAVHSFHDIPPSWKSLQIQTCHWAWSSCEFTSGEPTEDNIKNTEFMFSSTDYTTHITTTLTISSPHKHVAQLSKCFDQNIFRFFGLTHFHPGMILVLQKSFVTQYLQKKKFYTQNKNGIFITDKVAKYLKMPPVYWRKANDVFFSFGKSQAES